MTPCDTIIHEHICYLDRAANDDERAHVLKTIDFTRRTPLAFERDHKAMGHIGATAVIVDMDAKKILLTQHTILKTWAFFGNHADGCLTLLNVARARIAKNVSHDFANKCRAYPAIFDVDVHYVPAHIRKGENIPPHLHYDISYLFSVSYEPITLGNNKWFSLDEATSFPNTDSQFRRILEKLVTNSSHAPLSPLPRQNTKNPLFIETP